MAPPVQTSALRQVVAALCACLLTANSPTFAATDSCPATITEIRLPTTRPSRCIEVRMKQATIVLDMSLVRAHAQGAVATHAGDPRLSRLAMLRANELLQTAPAAAAGADCASIDADSQNWGDWLHYIALQIDSGKAVVYPTDSDIPATAVVVRDRPMCGYGVGTRVYTLPGGRIVLPLVTSIS